VRKDGINIHLGDGARVGERDIYTSYIYCIHLHMHMHRNTLHTNARNVQMYPEVCGEGSCLRSGQGGGAFFRDAGRNKE